MAVISLQTMFEWCGLSVPAVRDAVKDTFAPDPLGMATMRGETAKTIDDACDALAKGDNAILINRAIRKRLTLLVHWVDDQHRIRQEFAFAEGTSQATFLNSIADAMDRIEQRKNRRTKGDRLIGKPFGILLKSSLEWKRWGDGLDSILRSIIGMRGIPVWYVIRSEPADAWDPNLTWEENAVALAPHTGEEFIQDAATVHQVILQNMAPDSDAYTYIRSTIRERNGRKDFLALQAHYDSKASRDAQASTAKKTIATMRYQSERNFSFEKFSSQLQRAVDALEECDIPMHNQDIVDAIFGSILAPGMQPFKIALKLSYGKAVPDYKEVLLRFAKEIPEQSTTVKSSRYVSETTSTGRYTAEGPAPAVGAITTDGSIYIGKYDRSQWFSDEVKPYHAEILKARPPRQRGKRPGGTKSPSKRQVKKLKRQISQLKTSSEEQSKREQDLLQTVDQLTKKSQGRNNQAGNSFGGRDSKRSGSGN